MLMTMTMRLRGTEEGFERQLGMSPETQSSRLVGWGTQCQSLCSKLGLLLVVPNSTSFFPVN